VLSEQWRYIASQKLLECETPISLNHPNALQSWCITSQNQGSHHHHCAIVLMNGNLLQSNNYCKHMSNCHKKKLVLQEACAYRGPWWEQRNTTKEKLTQREKWSKLLKNQRMVSTKIKSNETSHWRIGEETLKGWPCTTELKRACNDMQLILININHQIGLKLAPTNLHSAWNINFIPSNRPTVGPLHPILASIIFYSYPKSKPGLTTFLGI
jgi:hypothetical protein